MRATRWMTSLAVLLALTLLLPAVAADTMHDERSIEYSSGDDLTWSVTNMGNAPVDAYLMNETQFQAWSDEGTTDAIQHQTVAANASADGSFSEDYDGDIYLLVVSQDPSSIDVEMTLDVESGGWSIDPVILGGIALALVVAVGIGLMWVFKKGV